MSSGVNCQGSSAGECETAVDVQSRLQIRIDRPNNVIPHADARNRYSAIYSDDAGFRKLVSCAGGFYIETVYAISTKTNRRRSHIDCPCSGHPKFYGYQTCKR